MAEGSKKDELRAGGTANAACCSLACALAAAFAFATPQTSAAQSVVVREASLKRNCQDKGTSDHPLVGKEFEACLRKQIEALPALDKARREHFGERYDPPKYVECRLQPGNRNSSACNVFILRRREWPEYWPEYAVRPKWPEAPKENVYRKGMKPREYWEALCKAEAGEFIHRTVNNVEGVFHARPRAYVTDAELEDRYVLEDPLTITDFLGSPSPENDLVQPYLGQYRFLEMPAAILGKFARHARVDPSRSTKKYATAREGRYLQVPYIVDTTMVDRPTARYGFVWRGIQRPQDRDSGIAGSEFAVVDLATGDVLALRRGFAHSGFAQRKVSGFWWMSALRCPNDRGAPTRKFLYSVLRPNSNINADIRPLEN